MKSRNQRYNHTPCNTYTNTDGLQTLLDRILSKQDGALLILQLWQGHDKVYITYIYIMFLTLVNVYNIVLTLYQDSIGVIPTNDVLLDIHIHQRSRIGA